MQMTWVGAPTIYYGDEAGVPGFTDPDSRRPYPWGHEDETMLSFYRTLLEVRRSWDVFRDGSLIELYEDGPVIAYGRFKETSQAVVIVNAGDERRPLKIPVWLLGLSREEPVSFKRLFKTHEPGFNTDKFTIRCEDGLMELKASPHEAMIFGRKTEER